eukprot:1195144-Prorocentrum_minimum.AAC.9
MPASARCGCTRPSRRTPVQGGRFTTRVFPSPTWRRPGRQARRAGPAVIRRSTVRGGAAPWGSQARRMHSSLPEPCCLLGQTCL